MRRLLIALLAVILLAACSPFEPDNREIYPTAGTRADRLLRPGVNFYVDPNANARIQAGTWRILHPNDARLMDCLAAQPQADWFGEWSGDIRQAVNRRVTTIMHAGALPVLVAYNIPARDCGSYSAGGANSPAGYRDWIREFGAGIGSYPAVVILEPDALAQVTCLRSETDREMRYQLLTEAVEALEALPNVDVYVDAGHSRWVPVGEMAARLQKVGVTRAAGFSLNVSNFQETADLIEYGRRVSEKIDGEHPVHFVIDTSRNGNGPLPPDGNNQEWCNPPGRALGTPPTVNTADPLVDAYLWIKRPGESDGTCRGGPQAGSWWPAYALELVRAAEERGVINCGNGQQ